MKSIFGFSLANPIAKLRSIYNSGSADAANVSPTHTLEERLAEAYLSRVVKNPATFVSDICSEDEMYLFLRANLKSPEYALYQYMYGGKEAIQVIDNIVMTVGKDISSIRRMLDFACGYGKSTRFLVELLDPGKIWVSDIYTGAVEFQRSTFGVNGLYSSTSPDDVDFVGTFEVIYVGSLFSHLPERQFKAWLTKLYELLDPDGVLIFSTQGPTVHQLAGESASTGFQFVPESESRSLDKGQYGSTTVTDGWVRRIGSELGIANIAYLERELWAQDVFVVSRETGPSLANIRPNSYPLGTLEAAAIDNNDQISASGWAVDRRHGAPIKSVRILVDGIEAGTAELGLIREDVSDHFGRQDFRASGWRYSGKLAAAKNNSILTAIITSRDGCQTFLISAIASKES